MNKDYFAIDAAVADINLNATSHKILRNGRVLILRDGKTYTVQGQEVK